jgi:bifunctional enzyme CysN/CysC
VTGGALQSDEQLARHDFDAYVERHQQKELLRLVTVGSVDDGKSTLIGRLLHDTKGIYEDQLSAVRRASTRRGMALDLSLFTDGLKAEREQGITIDVAYRYFSTEKRKFIIADTPGHVQYTRNMATGASTADVVVTLIDARLGVLEQSRRHAFIASLLGIPHLCVCINKMDLVGFASDVFERISGEMRRIADVLGFRSTTFIPVSALDGENVVHRGSGSDWYEGKTLLEYLESVPLAARLRQESLRYPVQYVLRPDLDYRGFAGQIASGRVAVGDSVMVLPSRRTTRVAAIDAFEGGLETAFAPMSVTLRLAEEVDVSRGDMLVPADDPPRVVQRFEAMLVWMAERALDPHKSYLVKHTTRVVRADIEKVAYTIDLENLSEVPARKLELNDIGRVTIACHRPLFLDSYKVNRATGAFILIDTLTNNTVAAGMILEHEPAPLDAPQSARNGPHTLVAADERRSKLGQSGAVVWLTGLPGAGKSVIAYALERQLFDAGHLATVIDPDDGLSSRNRPDGSSPRFTPEMARRFADSGVIAIFAFASPLRADRAGVRAAVGGERFVEVHVGTSAAVRQRRDRRGNYDSAHVAPIEEAPVEPDVRLALDDSDADASAAAILDVLVRRGLIVRS